MKRLICILPLCLLLCACAETVNSSPEPSTAARAVIEACEETPFIRADKDFIADNFAELPSTRDEIVYFAESNDGTEIGFFLLNDSKDIPKAKALIRDYIDSERHHVNALAALYPGEELNARLARYDGAAVGHRGELVYYIIGDRLLVQKAERALQSLPVQ